MNKKKYYASHRQMLPLAILLVFLPAHFGTLPYFSLLNCLNLRMVLKVFI